MTTYRIRLVPHLETHRSVHFEPVVRDLKPCDDSDNLTGRGTVVKIGRFTEKAQQAHDQAQAQRQGQGQNGAGGILASETVGGNMARGEAWRGAGGGGDVTAPSSRDGADFGGAAMRTTVNGNGNAAGSGSVGAGGGGPLTSNKVAFRSKVVSRAHAEFWVEAGGQVSFSLRIILLMVCIREADHQSLSGEIVLHQGYAFVFWDVLESYQIVESNA
jgi:hypothetical protein